MEVLSARMAPAFKGEESWKYKRVYENKVSRQADAKVEPRTERGLHFENAPTREVGSRKAYAGHFNGWEGASRQAAAPRSVGRTSPEGVRTENGRKVEMPESSEDIEMSQDGIPEDDSENSGDDEPSSMPDGGAIEAPQKWPIIQIVDPPPWLPDGWTAVLRTRESGSKDKYYVDPETQRRFRSKTEVNYFLQTGKSYRYKRNLALLTKPLKEDPISLPNTGSVRNAAVEVSAGRDGVLTLPFMGSSAYGHDHRGIAPGQGRPGLASGALLSQADPSRKPYNKPGPKPKIKGCPDEPGRQLVSQPTKRNAMDQRRMMEQLQNTENRGKLILKLKRKTAELDEAQRDGKKPRPFEVVGSTPMSHAKSMSTSSDEDGRLSRNPWAMDLAADGSSRAAVAHSVVPTLVNVLPRRKNSEWLMQSRPPTFNRPYVGGGSQTSGGNGQVQQMERTSGSNTPASAEAESVKVPAKRESPAEQLQRLGRKLCLQAVHALRNEHYGMSSLQDVSLALHGVPPTRANGTFNPHYHRTFNPSFSSGSHVLPGPPLGSALVPAVAPYQHQPTKRMRGSTSKEKALAPPPSGKYPVEQFYGLPAQSLRE